jgi:hypothetical protein
MPAQSALYCCAGFGGAAHEESADTTPKPLSIPFAHAFGDFEATHPVYCLPRRSRHTACLGGG